MAGARGDPGFKRALTQRGRNLQLKNLPDPTAVLSLGKVVGRGAYGKVYRGNLLETQEAVAVKVVNLDGNTDSEEDIALEIQVRQCECPFPPSFWLITPPPFPLP